MNSQKTLSPVSDETIMINRPADIVYWAERLSVSPFTLFHLLKTVGNSAREIGEFLHKQELERANNIESPEKKVTIL